MKKILLLLVAVITSVLLVGCDFDKSKAEVSTPEEFFEVLFAYVEGNVKYADTMILTEDLDFSGYEWPLGYDFGFIKGEGHTIKNITIQVSEGDKVGMFESIKEISDLNIENLNVTYYGKDGIVGGITAAPKWTVRSLSNIKITGKIYAPSAECVGGLIGKIDNIGCELKDIDIDMTVTGGNHVGGAIGYVYERSRWQGDEVRAITLENVTNRGDIISKAAVVEREEIFEWENNKFTSESYAGGLVGAYYNDIGTVNNCKNYGTVKSNKYAGGLMGDAIISSCKNSTNEGAVSTVKTEVGFTYVGGIAATLKVSATVENCQNTAKIESTGESGFGGGIAGYLYTEGRFVQCKNSGQSVANTAGGMVGYCEDNSQFLMCENTAEVGSLDKSLVAGGIAGYAKNAFVNQCTNSGSISAFCCGGIVGKFDIYDTDAEGVVISSTNNGNVTASSKKDGYAGGIIAIMDEFEMIGIDTNTNTGELSGWKTEEIVNIVEME